MRKRNTYNFAEGQQINASELDTAVATAQLVSMLDPKAMNDEEVKTVAHATGTSEAFVDEIADLVDEAHESDEKPEVKAEKFSNAASKVIEAHLEKANFSRVNFSEKKAEEVVAETAKIASLLSDEVIEHCKPEEIAETITEATETPKEVVEPIVEAVVEKFSRTKAIYDEAFANFSAEVIGGEEEHKPSMEPVKAEEPKEEPKLEEAPVVAPNVETPVKDIEQPKENEKIDPKPGDEPSDPKPAGEALAIQNELAIVKDAADVPAEPEVKKDFSALKDILGSRFIPNK